MYAYTSSGGQHHMTACHSFFFLFLSISFTVFVNFSSEIMKNHQNTLFEVLFEVGTLKKYKYILRKTRIPKMFQELGKSELFSDRCGGGAYGSKPDWAYNPTAKKPRVRRTSKTVENCTDITMAQTDKAKPTDQLHSTR